MTRTDQALYQAKRDGRNRVQYVRRTGPQSDNGTTAAVAA
jgi:hypothetical protein